MEVVGLKYLNDNSFDEIIITKSRIVAKGNSKVKYEKGEKFFSNRVSDLNDFEKVSATVDYFLDYSKVAGMDIERRGNSKYILISGSNGRVLRFGFQPDRKILNKIKANYDENRLSILLDSLDKNYFYSFYTGTYGTSFYEDDDFSLKNSLQDAKTLHFRLLYKNEGDQRIMLPDDLEFLYKAMSIVFKDKKISYGRHSFVDRYGNSYNSCCYLTDTEHYVLLDEYSSKLVGQFVYLHNEGVEEKNKNNKSFQLKMEGF